MGRRGLEQQQRCEIIRLVSESAKARAGAMATLFISFILLSKSSSSSASLSPTRSHANTHQTQHDLAEQHVLERLERPRIPVVRLGETLKRLEEVRVRRLVVLVVGVDCSGLQVERGLEERRAVDRVGGGSGGRESSLGGAWASARSSVRERQRETRDRGRIGGFFYRMDIACLACPPLTFARGRF